MSVVLYREDLIKEINKELLVIKKDQIIAVWGIGNYAVNLFAYTNLNQYKISYYIDENKGGDYFGGQIIQNPNQVRWDSVDVTIILAYYKHYDVEKCLLDEYGFNGTILKPGIGAFEKEFYKYDPLSIRKIRYDYMEILNRNVFFKDIHRNKRCFILGNGPSLNDVDLGLLSGEICFAVNQFFRIPQKIEIQYYVLADPFFFDTNYFDTFLNSFYKGLKDFSCGQRIKFWCPIKFKDNIKRIGLDEWADIFYFFPDRVWDNRVNDDVDFSERIPGRWSVIQYCVFLAVYMGIKEIYLLGCEETGIYGTLDSYLKDGYTEYAFQIPQTELDSVKKYAASVSLPDMLQGFAKIYKGYNEVNTFCEAHGVKIYTCAKKTLVSGIEYRDLTQII